MIQNSGFARDYMRAKEGEPSTSAEEDECGGARHRPRQRDLRVHLEGKQQLVVSYNHLGGTRAQLALHWCTAGGTQAISGITDVLGAFHHRQDDQEHHGAHGCHDEEDPEENSVHGDGDDAPLVEPLLLGVLALLAAQEDLQRPDDLFLGPIAAHRGQIWAVRAATRIEMNLLYEGT